MNVTIVGGGLTGLTAAYYLGHVKPESVSYTHLDVYKRQSHNSLQEIVNLIKT